MRDGAKYKVKENVEIKPNGLGGRGIEIAEHANVTLNIEEGKTLTVTGRRSMDHRPGRAAIYLPQDSKLTVEGNGTLIAKGGDASPGEAGGKAQDSYVAIGEYLSVGHAGQGGASAFGGGSGANGDEGASNGGDDTGASRKYARAGGAGGACPEPVKGTYTCTPDPEGNSPIVIGGTFEYDGLPHGATVGSAVSNGGEYRSPQSWYS